MSEDGDYTPAPHWAGYDFDKAKSLYKTKVDRSYGDAISKGVVAKDLIPVTKINTKSEAPIVIAVDVTASMGDWPAVIFSKLPYLEQEGQEYLGKTMEISFAAIGDAYCDKYPLQVQPFVKGADLKASLEKLVHESGGGGTSEESYDLAALYYARNCEMPEAVRKPIFIFIGDEGIYRTLSETQAKQWCEVTLTKEEKSSVQAIFEELKEKFSVYVIRKPYGSARGNVTDSRDAGIHKQWATFLGDDHVISLPEAARVVDVIFGILAEETGRVDYFKKELEDRQGKDVGGAAKVDVVLKSLVSVHNPPSKHITPKNAKSVMKNKKDKSGGKSISLLED